MKRLIAGQIAGLDPQQILKRASDIMAFHHFGGAVHRGLEPRLRGFGMFRQADRHIDHIGPACLRRIKPRPITPDHAPPLQILDPAQAGARRQADPVSQIKVALLGIARQFAQYFGGDGVNIGHGLQD